MKRKQKPFIAIFTLLFLVASANAASGDLDLTFGDGGRVIHQFGGVAKSVAIQSDGKILVAGYREEHPFGSQTSVRFPILRRLSADGSIDFSFDYVDEGEEGYYYDLEIQSNGKIVVAGQWGSNGFKVGRFNSDGSRDTTFGSLGVKTILFSHSSTPDVPNALAIQPDGKIIVAGQTFNGNNFDFAIARLGIFGSLDTTFSGDGKLTVDLSAGDEKCTSAAINSTGSKIVVAGSTNEGSGDLDFFLVMLRSDGSFDTAFAGNGRKRTDFYGLNDEPKSVLFDGSKVLAAGYSTTSSTGKDVTLARYYSDGSLDTTFSGDGKLRTVFGYEDDAANAVRIQLDGKIVVAGYTFTDDTTSFDFAVARFTSNGFLDGSFGAAGKVRTDFFFQGWPVDTANGLAIQADGKLVAAGGNTVFRDTGLARYEP